MSQRYAERVLVHVLARTGLPLRYGFQSPMTEADKRVLGQVDVNFATPPPLLVITPDSPKPHRASRRRITTVTSSYISADQIASARAAGWRVSLNRKLRGSGGGRLSNALYVTISQIKYTWSTSVETYTLVGAANYQALGVQLATAQDDDLVWAPKFPIPGKAVLTEAGQDQLNQYETFVDPSREDNLPDGWSLIKGAITQLS